MHFTSDDGTQLYGWWIPASGQPDAGTAPTVIHVHGNAGNIESHQWFSEHLPKAGLNVFLFDFRGYGQSEGRTCRRGPLIRDTEAALNYVLSRKDVDPNRIGLYGHSLGGAIGLNVMAKRDEIRAAVLESAFASWREAAATAVGGDPPSWWARSLAWVLIDDSDRPDVAIAGIDRPVLILHGDSDSIVPISHSRTLAAAAVGPVEFVELSGGEHNTLKDTHPEIEQMMIDFFGRTLASEATSDETEN